MSPERMLADTDIQFTEEIRLDEPVSSDIAEEVATYFGAADPSTDAIAAEVTVDPQF